MSCPGRYGRVFCMRCYLGAKGKAFFPGHRGYKRGSSLKEWQVAAFKLDRPAAADKNGAKLSLSVGEFGENYPALWAHLTQAEWPDGSPRLTSSLLVFSEMGKIKVMLADKSAAAVCFVTGVSWEGTLTSLEGQLQEGRCDWRPDRAKRSGGR